MIRRTLFHALLPAGRHCGRAAGPFVPGAVLALSLAFSNATAAGTASAASAVYRLDDEDSLFLTDDASGRRAQLVVGVEARRRAAFAAADPSPGRHSSLLDRAGLRAVIAGAAARHGVSSALIDAVIASESAYRSHAVSPRGALGLMQLMPATARQYGVGDPFDAAQNIDAGARHLRALIDRFRGDTVLALAAYNAGVEAVVRHGHRIPPFAETLAYVPRVLQQFSANVRRAAEPQRLLEDATTHSSPP